MNVIHPITGHHRLFDTVLVYENYPTAAAALSGADGLAITEVANRDYYHYPLAIQAVPGAELDLRVQYRTDVFDSASISTLTQQYMQVLVGMTSDATAALSSMTLRDSTTHPRRTGRPRRCRRPNTTPPLTTTPRPPWSNRSWPASTHKYSV